MITKNTGLIKDKRDNRDRILGSSVSNITVDDWFPYFSDGELQYGIYYDTMSCVTFSALNIVEAIMNYKIEKKIINKDNIKWLKDNDYFDDNGKLNFSDRYTAALSGTTSRGNRARNVWDSIRHDGLVPEVVCDWDRSRNAPKGKRYGNWFRNKNNISEDAKKLGKEFAKRFDIEYLYVPLADIDDGLKNSPIQVFISTRCKFINGIEQRCGYGANHAVTLYDKNDSYLIFDHYYKTKGKGQERFIRKVSKDYKFWWRGYTCIITEKENIYGLVKNPDNPKVYYAGKNKIAWIKNEESFIFGRDNGFWGDWGDIKIIKTPIKEDIIF